MSSTVHHGQISEHDDGEEEEASLYFYVETLPNNVFYKIVDDEEVQEDGKEKFLAPFYEMKHQGRLCPGFAAVGSTIYVIGGGSVGLPTVCSTEVMYVDTNDPDKEWKDAESMMFGRANPVTFTVDGKIYAIGGIDYFDDSNWIRTEIYDPESDKWTQGNQLSGLSKYLTVHAVLHGGEQVLMHAPFSTRAELISYHVAGDAYGPCPKLDIRDFGRPHSFAVLDNDILFVAGYASHDFVLMGYDFRKKCHRPDPVPVKDLDKFIVAEGGGPSPYRIRDMSDERYVSLYAKIYLVPIGRKKLALVWARQRSEGLDVTFDLFCLKMKLQIKKNKEPGKIELIAQSGSLSSHRVKGRGISRIIPVYPGLNRREQKEKPGGSKGKSLRGGLQNLRIDEKDQTSTSSKKGYDK